MLRNKWIYKGDFRVTSDMVSNGKMIKELIPREVTGDFICFELGLTSLIGSPESVGGYFNCENNNITSLEGSPKSIRGSFWCDNNKLTTLEGSPKTVSGHFSCSFNQLTTLKGSPKIIKGSFYCSNNELTSLEGGPKEISGDFWCDNNKINLDIEKDYIMSDFINDNYYLGLLKYMIHKSIDLTEITSWPEGFLTDNMIRSAKGISKFQL